MNTEPEEEKADKLVAYLDVEAFENYFGNFAEDIAPNTETRSFQKVKLALLEKFSTKKTEEEVMKEVVNLEQAGSNIMWFFVEVSKMYKEVVFNDQAKFELIKESIQSDQRMLQFLFLRKADTYEKVRENYLEYEDNQKFFASQGEQLIDQARSGH